MSASGWKPSLNPTQQAIFDSTCKFILSYGERASGKTIGALHKMVRHAYENENALCIIITGVKRQAEEGGAWDKLIRKILPDWAIGLGFDQANPENQFFSDPKTNIAKDTFLWVRNWKNGWSRIVLLSMPVEGFVSDRVKGMEPSFVMVDEAQTLESDTYFTSIVQQIGRREGIKLQQIIYCCNPEGKRHWLYKRFWERSIGEDGKPKPEYARFHVPIAENRHNIPDDYWNSVVEAVRGDPVEEARMVRGEWVDRPSGTAIFKAWFIPEIHVKGDSAKNTGLSVIPTSPVIIGYDPGPVNFSVSFMQMVPTTERSLWTVFDEVNLVGEYMPYFAVVPMILERMKYWNERSGGKLKFVHISDEAAFSHQRSDGSFDAREIEELSKGSIRLMPCPKGKNSRADRVRLMISLLQQECLVVSALCDGHIEMFMHLESERSKSDYDPMAGFKPARSPHIHPFDSCSYPPFLYSVHPSRIATRASMSGDSYKPEVYLCGAGWMTPKAFATPRFAT